MHLNPVRAGLLAPAERLVAYPWSSLMWYLTAPEHRPGWIRVDRLLGELGLGADTAVCRQEFERLGWNESDLVSRRKSDPGKLGMAARSRQETTLTLKAIARRVQLGTSRSAHVRLHEWIKSTTATAESNEI